MTDGIRKAVHDWTGDKVLGCPWRAFHDPFVSRVLSAVHFAEKGNLAVRLPAPSHRLIEGLDHYIAVDNRVYGKQLDMERVQRAQKQAAHGK